MQTYFIELSYLLASILFILGLKGLSHPETAKRGMHLAEFGMLMAIIGTLLHHEIITYTWIITGLVIGSLVTIGYIAVIGLVIAFGSMDDNYGSPEPVSSYSSGPTVTRPLLKTT